MIDNTEPESTTPEPQPMTPLLVRDANRNPSEKHQIQSELDIPIDHDHIFLSSGHINDLPSELIENSDLYGIPIEEKDGITSYTNSANIDSERLLKKQMFIENKTIATPKSLLTFRGPEGKPLLGKTTTPQELLLHQILLQLRQNPFSSVLNHLVSFLEKKQKNPELAQRADVAIKRVKTSIRRLYNEAYGIHSFLQAAREQGIDFSGYEQLYPEVKQKVDQFLGIQSEQDAIPQVDERVRRFEQLAAEQVQAKKQID